jgi:hypothetical protein
VNQDTEFTYCEFSLEIRQRLSSRVDNPSLRRYISSLLTRSIMRSTRSLASMHQWSKLPILTQNSTILPWFSMRSMAKAIALALLMLRYEPLRVYGSCELPSSQYILFETIAFSPGGKWECSKICKIFGPYSSNQAEQDPFLLLNSRIHSVYGSRG